MNRVFVETRIQEQGHMLLRDRHTAQYKIHYLVYSISHLDYTGSMLIFLQCAFEKYRGKVLNSQRDNSGLMLGPRYKQCTNLNSALAQRSLLAARWESFRLLPLLIIR